MLPPRHQDTRLAMTGPNPPEWRASIQASSSGLQEPASLLRPPRIPNLPDTQDRDPENEFFDTIIPTDENLKKSWVAFSGTLNWYGHGGGRGEGVPGYTQCSAIVRNGLILHVACEKVTGTPTDSSGEPPSPPMIIDAFGNDWKKGLGQRLDIPESQPLFRWSRSRPVASNQLRYVVMISDGFIDDMEGSKITPRDLMKPRKTKNLEAGSLV